MKIVTTFPAPFQGYVQELIDILLKAEYTVDFKFFDFPLPPERINRFSIESHRLIEVTTTKFVPHMRER